MFAPCVNFNITSQTISLRKTSFNLHFVLPIAEHANIFFVHFKFSMMKFVKKFVLCMIVAVPLFLVPKQSKAGIIGDFLGILFGNDHKKKDKDWKPAPSNSVPLDGATIVLMAAGLGLGAKMLLGNKQRSLETAAV
jgi:hypothetical protein